MRGVLNSVRKKSHTSSVKTESICYLSVTGHLTPLLSLLLGEDAERVRQLEGEKRDGKIKGSGGKKEKGSEKNSKELEKKIEGHQSSDILRDVCVCVWLWVSIHGASLAVCGMECLSNPPGNTHKLPTYHPAPLFTLYYSDARLSLSLSLSHYSQTLSLRRFFHFIPS